MYISQFKDRGRRTFILLFPVPIKNCHMHTLGKMILPKGQREIKGLENRA